MKVKKNIILVAISCLFICAGIFAWLIFFNNETHTDLNSATEEPNIVVSDMHSISASTSLDNEITLSSDEASEGENITATVIDPKYGFFVSNVQFINDQDQIVQGVKYSLNDNVVNFIMPGQNVRLQITYDTIATNAYNDVKHYTGRMKWNKESGKVCDIDCNYGMDLFVENSDNTAYNQDLSVIGSLFSDAAYYRAGSDADLNGAYVKWTNMPSTDKPDIDVYTNLGFRDVEYVKFKSSDTVYESDDITDAYFAYCPVLTDDNEVVNCYVCSVRGTNGTLTEWASNFDVGADCNDYWAKNAPHWVNKTNHKGFDVTSELVLVGLKDYINKHNAGDVNKAIKNCIFVTGHSRGAGIANVLGAKIVDNIFSGVYFNNFIPFVYTYAPPKTSTASNAKSFKYDCIHNIINKDDTVPTLPYTSWGFKWYGKDHKHSIADDDSLEDLLEKKAGWIDYMGPGEGLFETMEWLANQMTETRKGIYKTPGQEELFWGRFCCYWTEMSKKDTIKALKECKYDRFCDTADWGPALTVVEPSPAHCMYYLANVAHDSLYLVTHPWVVEIEGTYLAYTTCFCGDGVASMKDPHQVLTYYVMVQNRIF